MQLKTPKASQRGPQALSFPKPSTMPQTHAGTGNWEWWQKTFFPTRHKAKQHQRLSTVPDSASATAQDLGKERGHSGLLRDGNERLRSHKRGGEHGCLFIILLYHLYYVIISCLLFGSQAQPCFLASDTSRLYNRCCTVMGNLVGKSHCSFPASGAIG